VQYGCYGESREVGERGGCKGEMRDSFHVVAMLTIYNVIGIYKKGMNA